MYSDVCVYFDMFGVDTSMMNQVIAAAMSSGAGYADLYFENTEYRDFLLRDGEVASGGIQVDFGVGVRALDGERTGYSYCETTALPEMMNAARSASFVASGAVGGIVNTGDVTICRAGGDGFYRMEQDWDDADISALISALNKLETLVRQKDERIIKVIARLSFSVSHVMMYNSLGQLCCDSRPMGSIAASIVFSDGRTTENRSASRSFRCGAEMLSDSLLEEIASELASGIQPMLEAGRPGGGKMPVVMACGASGILLHEAMGHAFEADFIRKGQSVFSDRMGQQVCPRGINVVDDATWQGNRGSCNFDDELVPGQKTYMVTDGVLTSYLHDRISANSSGVAPTGNGRRESFRFNPIPRMRLTYMESGNAEPSDMISDIKKGIYVDEFSNGQVKIGEGDFTFFVKSGRMIENGKLTMPVKDINIIGNGPRALADIIAVGNDLKIDNGTWTCGKDQNVPVGCGMPTVTVRELVVGGE